MKLLTLNLVTPEIKESFRIRFLSLEDILGSLGIYPEHEEFMTVLPRSVGYFIDETGKRLFFAYDYGVLDVSDNTVSVITRVFIKGESIQQLKEELEKRLSRIEVYEKRLRENIKTLERMILKEIVEIGRE